MRSERFGESPCPFAGLDTSVGSVLEGDYDLSPLASRPLNVSISRAKKILIVGTPIWMGQTSSVANRGLERMDALLSETDDKGRMVSYGRVAAVVVVGNEDGAHNVSADVYQALDDVGFTIPANAIAYWVGEVMGSTNFVALEKGPDVATAAVDMLVRNPVHLATLLQGDQFLALSSGRHQRPDQDRHFGLVADDRSTVHTLAEAGAAKMLDGAFLDFLDPGATGSR